MYAELIVMTKQLHIILKKLKKPVMVSGVEP